MRRKELKKASLYNGTGRNGSMHRSWVALHPHRSLLLRCICVPVVGILLKIRGVTHTFRFLEQHFEAHGA